MATFASLGIALGPTVGGIITSFLGWQWIFLLNVPVGIAGMLLAMRVVPDQVPERRDVRFDLPGTVLIVLALSSLLLALSQGNEIGWGSSLITALFIVSASLWCALLVWERRCPDPLIDLTLFRNYAFTLANPATLLIKMVFTGTIFLFPFYFELVKGYDTHIVGILLTVPAIVMMVTGPVAGRFSDRVGSRPLCSLGAVAGAVVFAAFALMTETIGIYVIVGAFVLRGIAGGLFMAPNRSLILGHSPPDRQGVASSLMKTIGNSGSAVGIVIFETIFAEAIAFGGVMEVGAIHETVNAATLAAGFELIFSVVAVLCLAAAAFSALANDPVPTVSERPGGTGEGTIGIGRDEAPAVPPATGSRS